MAAPAGTSRYKYISLESNPSIQSCSLRILVLHPAKDNEEPLQCALSHSTYGGIIANYAKLQYNAISYTWGTGERSQSLLVDDDSPKGASEVLICVSRWLAKRHYSPGPGNAGGISEIISIVFSRVIYCNLC